MGVHHLFRGEHFSKMLQKDFVRKLLKIHYFCVFGRKTQISGKFERNLKIFVENSIDKLNF